MMRDYDAGQTLGLTEDQILDASRRLSKRDFRTIREGIFRPLPLSSEVIRAFEENSMKMGIENPLNVARPVIDTMRDMLSLAPLSLEMFPPLYNPFDEEGMAEGGRVGYLAGGEVEDPQDEASAAAVWITDPEETKDARLIINGKETVLNTRSASYDSKLNVYLTQGSNVIKIIPKNDFYIAELKVDYFERD